MPKKAYHRETFLHYVAGCLKYQGLPNSLEDRENAVGQNVKNL